MSSEDLFALGADYRRPRQRPVPVSRTDHRQDARRISLVPGSMHLALPNARIIHIRRDPVDTCSSSFSKLFLANTLRL